MTKHVAAAAVIKGGPHRTLAVFGYTFFTFWVRDGPLEWVRPIPNVLERSWDAFGSIFSKKYKTTRVCPVDIV